MLTMWYYYKDYHQLWVVYKDKCVALRFDHLGVKLIQQLTVGGGVDSHKVPINKKLLTKMLILHGISIDILHKLC